ncbi:MAG: biotin--[acetyl-CoA-carboxylase] ligase [Lachnospiraceae bacterium]|nr:biotin--[acetyl-CoA-carboxylase] ligase [Candidatus Equihabitans merdae]
MKTKDHVLQLLQKNTDFVSGEMISKDLGISRMAVSTAVKTLRSEGYKIESVTRRGYRLCEAPDLLSLGAILGHLDDSWKDRLIYLESIDSTNNYLKQLAEEGAKDGTVVIANEQTKGKGRRGRQFLSLKDKGIYFSILLRPNCKPSDMATITAWTAVAIAKAITDATGLAPDIKWVNDLLMQGRKIAGILTEMSIEAESGAIDNVIIGIGINANQTLEDFPEELQQIAGSIAMASGHQVPRAKLAACMAVEMAKLTDAWPAEKEAYLNAYRQHCITTTDQDIDVIVGDKRRPARALSICDDFSLLVEYENGSRENLSSGEVSTRLR